MAVKQQVLLGRIAVDTYRATHTQLSKTTLSKVIPDAHTLLLNTMLAELKKQGFNSLGEFFKASEELNKQVGILTPDKAWK